MSAYSDQQRRDAFLSRVERVPFSGCWIWTGCADKLGYARVRGGTDYLGHRYAFRHFVADIPDDACVLHRCDVPCCVNPDHLFLGTHQDNMADRDNKGRAARLRGEANGNSKLTEAIVREILLSPLSQEKAAKHYGLQRVWVQKIRQRKVWAHVRI